ncbi:unnamed protein product [Urochloa humidicola]
MTSGIYSVVLSSSLFPTENTLVAISSASPLPIFFFCQETRGKGVERQGEERAANSRFSFGESRWCTL